MATLETPMGLSLLICDSVLEDKHTGKKSLVGLFDRIQTQSLPCVHPGMAVFVSITGGRGAYPCEIICRHQDGNALAFEAKGNVTLSDPRQVVDLVFRLNGIRFPEIGLYWVTFQVDEVPIMMRPLQVRKREEKAPAEKPPPDEAAGG